MSVVMLFSMVSFAQAYTVSFDWDGTGASSGLTDYEAFQLNSFSPITTYQDATTGAFNETFTVLVLGGYKPGSTTVSPYFNPDSMFITLSLSGQYVDDSHVYFTGGTATMFDATNEIATFSFDSALVSQLTGSLLTDENLGMKIDFAFIFDSVNPDYWGTVEQELVGKSWLLSVVGGRIDENSVAYNANTNEYVINWVFPGARMEFEAVPEPSTILLLGSGFLGVALFGRRKFFKKS